MTDITKGSFVWDTHKEQINIQRHKLSFIEATQAFFDQNRLVLEDKRHAREEARYFCIGLVKGQPATVRFTYRGEKIRVIGAGYWRKWRKLYEKENKKARR